MKILFHNTDTPEIVIRAIQRVSDKLTADCSSFTETSNVIYVIVDTEKNKLQTPLIESSALEDSFAHVESNYFLREENKNTFVHLIVVHYQNCALAQLAEDELVGVILHELGHLINDSTDEPVPSFLEAIKTGNPFDANDIEIINYKNIFTRECYADYYARKHGFGNEVASSLLKHIRITSVPPSKIVSARIAVLSAPAAEEMQGKIKALKNI